MRTLSILSLLIVASLAAHFLLTAQAAQAEEAPAVPVSPTAKSDVAVKEKDTKEVSKKAQATIGLTFVKNRITITAAPDAKKITVPYLFENKTKRTIKIARYDSACSCLSAKVKGGKLEYKPGEKGELRVDFALGSFSGFVEKTVLLWTTDDTDEVPSSVLTVALTIPELFEISPKTVFWDQNGPKGSKVVKLKVNNTEPIRILNHAGTNDNFVYELKTIRDGWEYELVVTPKDVSLPAFGMIKLTTDSAIPRYQRQMAFVCVRRVKPVPSIPAAPATPLAPVIP